MKAFISFLLTVLVTHSHAAEKLRITVQSGAYSRVDGVVSADVSDLKLDRQSSVQLYEKTDHQEIPVPCQVFWTEDKKPLLYWILKGTTETGATRTFIAEKTQKKHHSNLSMSVEDTAGALILKKNGSPILQYNYTHVDPPKGVDPAYGRSGFIHPAYSPAGNVLTAIQPKDHYHHYGIWNPWTRVAYDGQLYDLWNLADKKGTVRAQDIEGIDQGEVFAGYTASLNHYIFRPAGEKVIINERWEIKAWNIADGFLWDFESYLHPATDLSVLIKEYRYGGFTWRATQDWTKDDTEMLTSEGRARPQIDGSTARWIYVSGDTKTGRSGLLILSHPANVNAPEPLRVWDENANRGRGDVFVNFAPTKYNDWELQPENDYQLRYRVLSYEGEMTAEKAERIWNEYAHPPLVVVAEKMAMQHPRH